MHGPTIAFADFHFDPATGELRCGRTVVPLEPLPTRVLAILVARAGHLVTRAQLIEGAWPPGIDVSDRSLNTCVREIRNALGDGADAPTFIETVPRRGYRFIAAVHEPTSTPPRGPLGRRRVAVRTAGVAAVLASALIGWAFLRPTAPVRLLVLPFRAIDSTAATGYEASALTEAILSRLGRLPLDRLRVIGRTTADHFAAAGLSARALGDSLGVDYLVEGTIRRDAGGLVTSARIVRVSDQTLVWAQDFRGPGEGLVGVVPTLVSRMASVASAGRRTIPILAEAADTASTEARWAVLKGRYLLRTHDGHDRAAGAAFFREALTLDSTLAPAHAGLAQVALFDGRLADARREAERALSLDADDAQALLVLGTVRMVMDWRWDEAAVAFDRAVALAPGDQGPLHAQAFLYLVTGRFRRAVANLELVHALDPMSAVVTGDLGLAYYWAGRFDRARRYCSDAVDLAPRAAWPYDCLFRTAVQEADGSAASSAAARLAHLADSTRPFSISDTTAAGLARAYARWSLAGRRSEDRYASALAYIDLGLADSAVAALSAAADRRELPVVLVAVEPRAQPLRRDPRFRALLDRMRLGGVQAARPMREPS